MQAETQRGRLRVHGTVIAVGWARSHLIEWASGRDISWGIFQGQTLTRSSLSSSPSCCGCGPAIAAKRPSYGEKLAAASWHAAASMHAVQ